MAKLRYRGETELELVEFGRVVANGDVIEVPDASVWVDGADNDPDLARFWHAGTWSVIDAPKARWSTPAANEIPNEAEPATAPSDEEGAN